MVKPAINIIILTLLFLFSQSYSQSNQQIKQKNSELDKLQSDIQKLEKELSSKSKKEKETLQTLHKINNQNLLINKLINKLKSEEKKASAKIKDLNSEIKQLEKTISELKKEYSNYVVWLYKQGTYSTIEYLLKSQSLNQAILRYKYLNHIADQNELTLKRLNDSKEVYLNLKNELKSEINKKESLVSKKKREQRLLSKKKSERQKIITKIKSDKKALAKAIAEKRKAEKLIKNLIAKLIEKEKQAKLAIESGSESIGAFDYNYDSFESFKILRGKMNWPVRKGSIVRKFGKNKNDKTNTVTLNYGVDIRTKKRSEVYAVAEGVISAIEWIPGYGSVIIVTHKDNFRTVYGHLKDIIVNEGDKIIGGKTIGKVNESLEGSILHFEIWDQRDFKNPEKWLVKK